MHRHQLVHLSDEGWDLVRASVRDGAVGECLQYWATQRLPLVVTRQRCANLPQVDAHVALGIAAPLQWQRRRISVSVPRACIAEYDEFPRLDTIEWAWPAMFGPEWRTLVDGLAAVDAPMHVYGSWGWQLVTGLACIHEQSDVDLWCAVSNPAHADRMAHALAANAPASAPRIDGELVFRDGTAVAWREWHDWRAGRCREVLAKTLDGAALRSEWS